MDALPNIRNHENVRTFPAQIATRNPHKGEGRLLRSPPPTNLLVIQEGKLKCQILLVCQEWKVRATSGTGLSFSVAGDRWCLHVPDRSRCVMLLKTICAFISLRGGMTNCILLH